jgi:hypothetical protein
METQLVQVSVDFLLDYFAPLKRVTDDIPRAFPWNMHEIEDSDWANTRSEVVSLSAEINAGSPPIQVNHNGKRNPWSPTSCADGTFLKSRLVIPRVTLDTDVGLLAVAEDNCWTDHHPNGFIDRELFEKSFLLSATPEVETASPELLRASGPDHR